jgi:hypothetical protein
MSDAIAKALPTRTYRTAEQVGFARVGKLLRYFTNEGGSVSPELARKSQLDTNVLLASLCRFIFVGPSPGSWGNESVSVIIWRHDFLRMRP